MAAWVWGIGPRQQPARTAIFVVRLQKFLADAGMASRRAGERLILEGRVSVNGHVIRLLGSKVDPLHDHVLLDGKPVKERKKLYLALHKPIGCVCSHNDELGRPTVYDLLPKEWQVVNTVGRLDFNTEGLIFLTNDGQFALRLTHPRYGIRKKYVVTTEGPVTPEMLALFTRGVFTGGEKLKAEKAHLMGSSRSKSIVELELSEGKNREVRRLFESQNVVVRRLERVQIGKIKLGELKPGKWRALTAAEIKTLLAES